MRIDSRGCGDARSRLQCAHGQQDRRTDNACSCHCVCRDDSQYRSLVITHNILITCDGCCHLVKGEYRKVNPVTTTGASVSFVNDFWFGERATTYFSVKQYLKNHDCDDVINNIYLVMKIRRIHIRRLVAFVVQSSFNNPDYA